MKIKVQGQPEFLLAISLEDIAILAKVSAKHYDAVCREASADDGRGYDPLNRNFITAWRNHLEFDKKYYQPGDTEPMVTATWRNLDCSLKILESINLSVLRDPLERLVAERIRYDFMTALETVRPLYGKWCTEFDTAEMKND